MHAAQALRYLHSNGIIHRDIKLENMLINTDGQLKLCDLGLASLIDNINVQRETFCGTQYMMAPEMIKNDGYDQKVDVWALGMVLLEMVDSKIYMELQRSLSKLSDQKIIEDIISSSSCLSIYIKDLLNKMLKINPIDRISIKEVLNSYWILKKQEELKMNEKCYRMNKGSFMAKKKRNTYSSFGRRTTITFTDRNTNQNKNHIKECKKSQNWLEELGTKDRDSLFELNSPSKYTLFTEKTINRKQFNKLDVERGKPIIGIKSGIKRVQLINRQKDKNCRSKRNDCEINLGVNWIFGKLQSLLGCSK